jgi:hypothetical protein
MISKKKRLVIYIAVAVAVVIIGAVLMIFASGKNGVSAQEHIDLGRQYLIDLSYDKAIIEFKDAIDIDPTNPEPYILLAEAYEGEDDIESAVQILKNGFDETGDDQIKLKLTALNGDVQQDEDDNGSSAENTGSADSPETADVKSAEKKEEKASEKSAVTTTAVTTGTTAETSVTTAETTVTTKPAETAAVVTTTAVTTAETATTSEITVTTKSAETTTAVTTTEPVEEFITIKGEKYSTSLTELDLYMCDLTNEDIKPLAKMVNLERLSLEGNQISDISPLQNLTNLTYLNLVHNQISDISALQNLTKLEHLWLSNNQISDVSTLKNLTNLKYLYLDFDLISDSDKEELKKALPDCNIIF